MSPLETSAESLAEFCDLDDFDGGELYDETLKRNCDETSIANVGCAADCRGFEDRGPACCRPTDQRCPSSADEPRCCHEYTHPNAPQHCKQSFTDGSPPVNPEVDPGRCI
jgi:hypothetical protein